MKRSVMCQCENTCTATATAATAAAARETQTQKQSGNNRAQNNQWVHDAVPPPLRPAQHSMLIPLLIRIPSASATASPSPIPIPLPIPIAISILIPLGALTVIVINLASSAQSNSLGTLQTGLSLLSHCSAAAGVGMRVQKTWQLNSSSQSGVRYSTERTVGQA